MLPWARQLTLNDGKIRMLTLGDGMSGM